MANLVRLSHGVLAYVVKPPVKVSEVRELYVLRADSLIGREEISPSFTEWNKINGSILQFSQLKCTQNTLLFEPQIQCQTYFK